MSSACKPCLWEADGPQVLSGTWKLPAGPEGSRSVSSVVPSVPCHPLAQLCRLPLAGQVVDAVSVDVSVCVEKGVHLSQRKNALVHKGV